MSFELFVVIIVVIIVIIVIIACEQDYLSKHVP